MIETDGVKLRRILRELGFVHSANYTMYNDLNGSISRRAEDPPHMRRMKIMWADDIEIASNDRKWELVNTLRREFGDRLISCGLKVDKRWDGEKYVLTGEQNYVVKLKV